MKNFETPSSGRSSKQESEISKEKEGFSSRIKLSFMRHGEKEKDEEKEDDEIELTKKGKEQAQEQAENSEIDQSLAFGSPKKRAQETAGFAMAAENEEITGEESVDELKEKLNESLDKGEKVAIDKRLNFKTDPSTELGKAVYQAYKDGEFIKFVVEESDELAEKTGDTTNISYSKAAAQIASIVDKYIEVSSRWEELSDKEDYDNTMERVMGTHRTIGESFLAKVIEKTEGKEKRDEFVKVLDNNGFDFTEGFDVEILNKDNQENPSVKVSYKKEEADNTVFEFEKNVSTDLIGEIIAEGPEELE